MGFDHTHYVPVLRWKRGERGGLRQLYAEDRLGMTPLIELIPKNLGSSGNQFGEIADNIERDWGNAPLFVDPWLLSPSLGSAGLASVFERLAQEFHARSLSTILVTWVGHSPSCQRAVASAAEVDCRGACIRLTPRDIRRRTFPEDLQALVTRLGLRPHGTDLVVDCQLIDQSTPAIEYLSARIPELACWRTFTVLAGAFPKDLSQLQRNDQHLLPRRDWLAWRDQVLVEPRLARRPTFGDYTIQHAHYSEPPRRPHYSASIRYTCSEDWLIMRGESVFNDEGPGFAQWPANAQLLCDRPEFCGADFSYGDSYIRQMSLQTEKPGNAETWLRAGFNHHLTLVVRQIANLFGT